MRESTLLSVLVCVLAVSAAPARAQVEPAVTVPLPQFSGPLPVSAESYPFLQAARTQTPLNLADFGYLEQEYLVGGSANTYDWEADGSVRIRSTDAPYATRILIRRPADSADFSGNVVVETVNNARRYDWAFIWALSHDYLMARGDVFVAVTHTPEAIEALQTFDPQRYGGLAFPNPLPDETCGPDNAVSPAEEGLRWDMISQVGALLRSPGGPLADLEVERLYATTHTRELTTYANSVHRVSALADGSKVYDGFLIKSEYAPADRIRRCAEAPRGGDPRRIVRDAGVPVIRVTAQGDVPATVDVRREDSDAPGDRYRLWEVAGAPHMDKIYYQHMPVVEDQVKAGQSGFLANWPMAYACTPDIDLLDFPVMAHAVNAAFAALDAWVREDRAPPRAQRIGLREDGAFITDEHGNALGGLRSAWLEVPAATYISNSPGPAVCNNLGQRRPFAWPKLEALYGSAATYQAEFDAALERLAGEGWLTGHDLRKLSESRE